ncbi:MAG TPA: hypothetical protein VJR94_00405 [Candidatus Nitrosocosmicus sp.]|nr:hypothetical protein [Candidatus Nitrosocosmicus sp.]
MNSIILIFAIVGAFAASVLLVGVGKPAMAQDNITMNTSEPAPVANTTELTNTGIGLDGNTMIHLLQV